MGSRGRLIVSQSVSCLCSQVRKISSWRHGIHAPLCTRCKILLRRTGQGSRMISGGRGRWVARSVYLLVSQSSTGGRLGNADLEGNSARVFPRGRGATYMCLKIQLIQFNSNPSRLTPIPNHCSPENSNSNSIQSGSGTPISLSS